MIRAAICEVPGAKAREVSVDEALAWVAGSAQVPDQVAWFDCAAPGKDEIAALEAAFGLHPLTIEDLTHRNQRAKLEEYPGYLFLVLHWFASADTTAHPQELHVVLGRNWIATVCEEQGIAPVDEAWRGFLKGHSREPHGADGELYRLLDLVIDSHVPILTTIEDRLEHLSIQATRSSNNQNDISRVVVVRRALVRIRRAMAPARDLIAALSRREHGFINHNALLWFRDVSDHVHRQYEAIESLRELAQSVMEVQLALVERQQNQVIQRLTILSTIFLPLTFLTGFFGMNFAHLPFDDDRLLALALGAMVVLPAALLAWFRRKGWVGH